MGAGEVQIDGIAKTFESRAGVVQALAGVDLRLGGSEFVCLVGASGCGKSTLLSVVAGLESASTGTVTVDGRAVDGPGRDRGVVFQGYTLLPWLTARQNIEFALTDAGSKRERRTRADEQLRLVGLEDAGDRLPRELSGGMRQRVAIARALSYRPSVLLMDEPFGALDAFTRKMMQELLTEVWEAHRLTVLFVTHDVDEAVFLGDRVVVMSSRPGRVKESIPISLPRPRGPELLALPEFGELKLRVLESIREELAA